jgi:5-methylthioadenosine/S-adenosylhomocysteine deaminase
VQEDLSATTAARISGCAALADDELERRQLSKAPLPHVRRFYAGYFDPEAHQPYYRPSSRV